MKSIMLLIWACMLSFALSSQDPLEKLEAFYASYPTEKVYCSLDKPYYLTGDRIWGAVYLVDGSYHEFLPQGIVHVDLIDPKGEKISELVLKAEGRPVGFSFDIDLSYGDGSYTLRAYTQYQKNFPEEYIYQQEIPVVASLATPEQVVGENLEMEFYPEGGYMVNGLEGKIGFIAKDENGNPVSIEGQVLDSEGNMITELSTWTEGIGSFSFMPMLGGDYRAMVKFADSTYNLELPKALKIGTNLSATTVRTNQVLIQVRSNANHGLKNNRIVIHSRGVVQVDQRIGESQEFQFLVDKSSMPAGLLHITLFDAQSRPIAERLVFNHLEESESVEVKLSKDIYETKEKAVIDLSATKENYAGFGTVSIYLNSLFDRQYDHASLASYLLMNSDLARDFPGVNKYVHDNTTKNRALLDAILMTYGWKRFDWLGILEEKGLEMRFPEENSFSISGQVLKANGKKGTKADVILTVMDDEDFEVVPLVTDESGIFYIDGFDFSDTTEIMIQASKHTKLSARKNNEEEFKRRGNKDLLIDLFDLSSLELSDSLNLAYSIKTKKSAVEVEGLEDVDEFKAVDELDYYLDQGWSIDLEEITVSASRLTPGQLRDAEVKRRYEEKDIFFFASTPKYLTDEQYLDQFNIQTIPDLIYRVVPGARKGLYNGIYRVVVGPFDNPTLPTIVVDGVIMDENQLFLIHPDEIAVVDVITGLRANGLYGSGYVISMLTYGDGEGRKIPSKGTALVTHPGFYEAATFSSFLEERDVLLPPTTTIYWNPSVDLSEPLQDQFNTGTLPGAYRVKVEGLSEDGTPFYMEKEFVVK